MNAKVLIIGLMTAVGVVTGVLHSPGISGEKEETLLFRKFQFFQEELLLFQDCFRHKEFTKYFLLSKKFS